MQIPTSKFVEIFSSDKNRRIMITFSFIRQCYLFILWTLLNFPEKLFAYPVLNVTLRLCWDRSERPLLNESALSLLVGFLAKSVRNELPKENSKWANTRRRSVIRTLEKRITSDDGVVAALLKLDILTLLAKALDSPGEAHETVERYKTEELRATLTCLWTLSQNADALQLVARNASLVKGPLILTV